MIEKVAKEMYLAYANHPEARWEYADPRMQEGVWKLQARAALQALMTPTPGMVEAGRAAWLESASDYTRLHESISAAFSAMIRAALEEGS